MNVKAILFTFFSVGCCTLAIAAPEEKSNLGKDTQNLFSEPLDKAFGQTGSLPGEDIKSPFIEAHAVEQDTYTRLYYKYYHATYPLFNDNIVLNGKLPSPVDAKGHVLWFDLNGVSLLSDLVTDLYRENKIEDLDRLLRDWSASSERVADGRPKLVIFENSLQAQFNNVSDWSREGQWIEDWKRQYPKSPAIAFIDTEYWIQYAWNARGFGYAGTVTPEGWRLYFERLKKAEDILIDARPYAESNPTWARLYLTVGNALGWPKQKLLTVFSEEAAKHVDFEPIYYRTADYLIPKWGGSWELLDAFVRQAVKMTAHLDGESIYARIYWWLALEGQGNLDLFGGTRANWPDMKQGFKDILKLYPHSALDLNGFAAAACAANDKDTYETVRFEIGKLLVKDMWLSNYSPDMCDHKFAGQSL